MSVKRGREEGECGERTSRPRARREDGQKASVERGRADHERDERTGRRRARREDEQKVSAKRGRAEGEREERTIRRRARREDEQTVADTTCSTWLELGLGLSAHTQRASRVIKLSKPDKQVSSRRAHDEKMAHTCVCEQNKKQYQTKENRVNEINKTNNKTVIITNQLLVHVEHTLTRPKLAVGEHTTRR